MINGGLFAISVSFKSQECTITGTNNNIIQVINKSSTKKLPRMELGISINSVIS